MRKGKGEQMGFSLELFVRASCSLLGSFVHHIVGGIKYLDIKLSCQRGLFVRASAIQQFIALCTSAYCRACKFWIKNWQDLDVRYQSIQTSLFYAPFLSCSLFCDIFSDIKLCSEAACTTGNHSTEANKLPSIRQLIYNIIRECDSFVSFLCLNCYSVRFMLLFES